LGYAQSQAIAKLHNNWASQANAQIILVSYWLHSFAQLQALASTDFQTVNYEHIFSEPQMNMTLCHVTFQYTPFCIII